MAVWFSWFNVVFLVSCTLTLNSASYQHFTKNSCNRAFGLENGEIKDDQLSANSYIAYMYFPGKGTHNAVAKYGRLNGRLAWCGLDGRPGYREDPYIQVDFGQIVDISGLAIQGLKTFVNSYYVKTYTVKFSLDGSHWFNYGSPHNKVWRGSSDANTINRVFFSNLVRARYLQLLPRSSRRRICLRMEIYGCYINKAENGTRSSTISNLQRTMTLVFQPSNLLSTLHQSTTAISILQPTTPILILQPTTPILILQPRSISTSLQPTTGAIIPVLQPSTTLPFQPSSISTSLQPTSGAIIPVLRPSITLAFQSRSISTSLQPTTGAIRPVLQPSTTLPFQPSSISTRQLTCNSAFGLENGGIKDDQLSANSYITYMYFPGKRTYKTEAAIAGLYVTSCMAAMLVAGISVAIIVVIVISITVLLLCFVFGVVYYRRRKPRDLPPDTDSVTHGENVYVVSCLPLDNLDSSSKPECFSWNEISRDCVVMGDVLGEGEFGLVVKAMLLDEQSNCDFPVAVKTVKDMATETDRGELLKELRLMGNVEEHPNVINLIGACSMEGPLLVIVEFCEFGSLLSYLRENRKELPGKGGAFVTSLDPLTRVRFAYDVAKGMCHLERKRIVHRDLAARNVLLGKNKIAKVSDFGLSRDIFEAGLYEKATGGRLPIKWMAIESLKEAKYTSKSDMWSFGVLFWEIETAGMIPYPGLSGIELLEYLQDGNRLPKPAETLSEMYELMKSCWEPSPHVRPHFQNIRFILEKYMEQRSDYVPISVDEDDNNAGPSSSYVNYNLGSPENQLVSTSL